MALTKQEVQFIDTYLKNSGVVYQDIRFEMTDHVASALEATGGDFMENFTAYMLRHKAELLQSNRGFARNAMGRAWKTFGKNLISPVCIVLFALVAWGFVSLTNTMEAQETKRILSYIYSPVIIVLFCHHFYNVAFAKVRFSVSDKLLSALSIFFYGLTMIVKPQDLIENKTAICIYYAMVTILLCAVYYTYVALIKKYRLQFVK